MNSILTGCVVIVALIIAVPIAFKLMFVKLWVLVLAGLLIFGCSKILGLL